MRLDIAKKEFLHDRHIQTLAQDTENFYPLQALNQQSFLQLIDEKCWVFSDGHAHVHSSFTQQAIRDRLKMTIESDKIQSLVWHVDYSKDVDLHIKTYLKERAQLDLFIIVNATADHRFFSLNLDIELAACAKLDCVFVIPNGTYVLVNPTIKQQKASEMVMRSLVLTSPEEFHTFTPVIHVQEPEAKSNLFIQSIVSGSSTTAVSGQIKVDPSACKISAHYKNNNLLLNESSKIKAQPDLDISCDDVVCSHGVTMGFLDREILNYCHARGLDDSTAKKMLLHSTCQSVYEDLQMKLNIDVTDVVLNALTRFMD